MYLNEDNLILSNKNFISFMGEINDLEILSPNINHISLNPNKKVKTYIKNKEYFTNLKLTDISKKKITELSSYEEFKDNKANSLIMLDATGSKTYYMLNNIIFLLSKRYIYKIEDDKNVKAISSTFPESFESFSGNLK